MGRGNSYLKVNNSGGVINVGELLQLLNAACDSGFDHLQTGNRQQFFFPGPPDKVDRLASILKKDEFVFEIAADEHPNIMSSYVSQDLFNHSSWICEGVYQDIINSFDHTPSLKINIVDGQQSFVPFFTGNLNFISSLTVNYWYLEIRFPKTNVHYQWPLLVYTNDIGKLSRLLEDQINSNPGLYNGKEQINGEQLFQVIRSTGHFIMQAIQQELTLPQFVLPYYEGFNRIKDQYWLGLYNRDEKFSISFLKEACMLCISTRINQVYFTPWKSIVIKNIAIQDRIRWDNLLGQFRINVRHAANELNWQTEDMCREALELKQKIARHFDKEDLRTYGLCFTIKTRPKTGLFGSVIIRKQKEVSNGKRKSFSDKYELLYTEDFNPNSKDLILFRKDLNRDTLLPYLVSLCKYFYQVQFEKTSAIHSIFRQLVVPQEEARGSIRNYYLCPACHFIYDPESGYPGQQVPPGSNSSGLPPGYCCPTCEEPFTEFLKIQKNQVV